LGAQEQADSMILTLEVIGEQAQNLGAGGRKVFNAVGGTIGRLPDNDWVFPDPYVSGRHALIRYLSGKYFIEDTSTNGVFVNSPDKRLSRSDSHQLRDGDVLFIDTYQIKVSLAKDPAAEQRNDPLALLQARHKKSVVPAHNEDHSTGTQWFGMTDISSGPKPALPDDAQLRALIEAAGIKGFDPSSEAAQRIAAALSAMRVAFQSMLSQFDPNRLQDEFDRDIKKGSNLGGPAKPRYWDLYRDKYANLTKDVDGAFRNLFGDAFARACKEQLERLQGSARGRDE
jgi:predicted component of type VI protein secretion system